MDQKQTKTEFHSQETTPPLLLKIEQNIALATVHIIFTAVYEERLVTAATANETNDIVTHTNMAMHQQTTVQTDPPKYRINHKHCGNQILQIAPAQFIGATAKIQYNMQ